MLTEWDFHIPSSATFQSWYLVPYESDGFMAYVLRNKDMKISASKTTPFYFMQFEHKFADIENKFMDCGGATSDC